MRGRIRIVIFSSVPPAKIRHFLWRLEMDAPEVEVRGVLYETARPPLPLPKRAKRFLKLVRDGEFRVYVLHKLANQFQSRFSRLFHRILRTIHCCGQDAQGVPLSLGALAQYCAEKDVAFLSTPDFHSQASLSFVRELDADLGVIFGARILKPQLFTIPRRGAINIHKHKVPEYRGSGAPGLWELCDGKTEATVTVHRVLEAVDAGAVLGERTFPIDTFDSLVSLGLKADLLAIDLLIEVLNRESGGCSVETPQPSPGTVYKGHKAHQIYALERRIRAGRPVFAPRRTRPRLKLVLHSLLYAGRYFTNRRRRARGTFSVTILFHHLITDKPHPLGLPTDRFLKQVRFLKKHYKVASIPEALAMLAKNKVTSPVVVLTFDDGYAENYLCLRAVAEAEEIPFTLFVCTGKATENSGFQHDRARSLDSFLPLRWDQIRYFDRHGITIGSHTRTHFDCGGGDAEDLWREIAGSREDIERELGHKAEFFSFPKGMDENMSPAALELAQRTYPYIFSAAGGVNHGPLASPCHLFRCAHPDTLWELALLMQEVLEFGKSPRAGHTIGPDSAGRSIKNHDSPLPPARSTAVINEP